MNDPLAGVKLKMSRAKEHLDALRSEVERFWQGNPNPFVRERHPEWISFAVNIPIEPSPRLSIIVGDIAFNLRSALDHLAWQLAVLHCGSDTTPRRYPEFPIFNCETNFKKGASRKLANILPAARSVIELLQPYHRGDWPELAHLWILHEVNRVDKHQTAVGHFFTASLRFSDIKGEFRFSPLRNGDQWIVPVKQRRKFKMKLFASLSFEFASIPHGVSFEDIEDIYKFVDQEVLPRFRGFFYPEVG